MQRFDIVNGVVEAEGATNEAAMDQEEDKAAAGIFSEHHHGTLSIVSIFFLALF